MRSLFITLILTFTMVGMMEAKSRTVGSPKATTGMALHSADYGGVDVSTGAFAIGHVTATLTMPGSTSPVTAGPGGSGVFHGIMFSTGRIEHYVDVWDSSVTHLTTSGGHIARIYNVANSTMGRATLTSGFSGPLYPMRFKRGLIWRSDKATGVDELYNIISVLFNQD